MTNNKSALAIESPELIFYRLVCPHCEFENVIIRDFMHAVMLCSSTGCKRVISVKNYHEIIHHNKVEKKIA